ncbi:ABC transporter substrate-binding protein [Pengzhenrongella sp.]|jgi:multiple sugar transport system substrate-binding protein|uniref:ABC transporter substrate-binding protein n=1 Tax=Pengzhenrongella sp. TaxID=2888820 RepID=UPI002F921291
MTRASITVISGVAIAALTLQGCAADDQSAGSGGKVDGTGKTINVLVGANSAYPAEQKKWFADMGAAFTKKTGGTLAYETFASANDELTKIQTSVLSGQGPDVYGLGTTFTPTAYSTDAFVKLTDADWKKVGGRDRFVPATLGISGPDEKNEIGVPSASRPFVIAYNKKLLAAAGIDKPADSWDGLRDQAKRLTKGGVYGISTAYADTFDPYKIIWGMSEQAGNPLVTKGKSAIDDPITVNAFQTYYDWLVKDHVVDPAAVGWKNSQALAEFAAGKSAFMVITSSTSKPTLDASAVKDDYAYAVMPTIPPGESSRPKDGVAAASILSGDNLVVADYSQNKDLALAYIEQVTSAAQQEHYYKIFGDLPTNAEASKSVLAGDKALSPLIDAAKGSVATPFTGAWGEIQLALSNVTVQLIPSLANGSVSPAKVKAAVHEAHVAAQTALDRVK